MMLTYNQYKKLYGHKFLTLEQLNSSYSSYTSSVAASSSAGKLFSNREDSQGIYGISGYEQTEITPFPNSLYSVKNNIFTKINKLFPDYVNRDGSSFFFIVDGYVGQISNVNDKWMFTVYGYDSSVTTNIEIIGETFDSTILGVFVSDYDNAFYVLTELSYYILQNGNLTKLSSTSVVQTYNTTSPAYQDGENFYIFIGAIKNTITYDPESQELILTQVGTIPFEGSYMDSVLSTGSTTYFTFNNHLYLTYDADNIYDLGELNENYKLLQLGEGILAYYEDSLYIITYGEGGTNTFVIFETNQYVYYDSKMCYNGDDNFLYTLTNEYNDNTEQSNLVFNKLDRQTGELTLITQTNTGIWNFSDSGGNDESGGYINDGGFDMYDGGNKLSTNLMAEEQLYLPYTHTQRDNQEEEDNSYLNPPHDGVIVESDSIFGEGSSYFTNMYRGLFVLGAENITITQFSVWSNFGTDGSGETASSTVEIQKGEITYTAYVTQVYGTSDPSINNIFIVENNQNIVFKPIQNTNSDSYFIDTMTGTSSVYFLLMSQRNGVKIAQDDIVNIATTFIDKIAPNDLQQTLDNLNNDPLIFSTLLPESKLLPPDDSDDSTPIQYMGNNEFIYLSDNYYKLDIEGNETYYFYDEDKPTTFFLYKDDLYWCDGSSFGKYIVDEDNHTAEKLEGTDIMFDLGYYDDWNVNYIRLATNYNDKVYIQCEVYNGENSSMFLFKLDVDTALATFEMILDEYQAITPYS